MYHSATCFLVYHYYFEICAAMWDSSSSILITEEGTLHKYTPAYSFY